jgi:hypothetical protein
MAYQCYLKIMVEYQLLSLLCVSVCVLQCSSCPARARPVKTQEQISCFTIPNPDLVISLPIPTRWHSTEFVAPPCDYWRPNKSVSLPYQSIGIYEGKEVGIKLA